MAHHKIEIADISNNVFFLLVLETIHSFESSLKKKGMSKTVIENVRLSIKGYAENKLILYYITETENMTIVERISFVYQSNNIQIEGSYKVDLICDYDDEDQIEDAVCGRLNTTINIMVRDLTARIKVGLQEYTNMANCIPYMFNKITCLNVESGKIETIRLTPYYNILNPDRLETYDYSIGRLETHHMVYDNSRNKCLATSFNKYEYGNVYEMSPYKIEEITSAKKKTTWIPINAIEQVSKLPLNKILVLKDTENADADLEYMFLSTKGIFLRGEVFAYTLKINNSDVIIYAGANKQFEITFHEAGQIEINYTTGETQINNRYNIEKVLDKQEAYNIESLKPYTVQLVTLRDMKIFDGTYFEPIDCSSDNNKTSNRDNNKTSNHNNNKTSNRDNNKTSNRNNQPKHQSKEEQKTKIWPIILLIIAFLLWLFF